MSEKQLKYHSIVNEKAKKEAIQALKTNIQSLVGDDKIDAVIAEMDKHFESTKNDDALNMLIVIKGDYKALKNRNIIGDIAFAEQSLKMNSIRYRLTEVCKLIEAHSEAEKAACKVTHGMLMYLSQNTNEKAVFVEDVHRDYYLRKPQGRAYINELSKLYLERGYGQFIPKNVTEKFYIIKAKIQKIIDHAEVNGNPSDRIQVTDEGIKKLVNKLGHQIGDQLKEVFE